MIKKNLETSVLLGIYEAATLLMRQNIEFVSKQGITNHQFVILIHLAKDPNLPYLIREKHAKPMMAYELADSLGVSRANITSLLKTLLEKELIIQIEDKDDRRKKRLTLSPKGENLIRNMQSERQASNKAMLVGLNKEEKEQFLHYIQRCTENILALKK